MDTSNPAPSYYTFPASGQNTFQGEIWRDYRTFAVSSASTKKTHVYKAFDEMSCSELCLTCDEISSKKCTSCQPNSLPSSLGDSCSCDSGFYESTKFLTQKSAWLALLYAAPAMEEVLLTVPPVSTLTWRRRLMEAVAVLLGSISLAIPVLTVMLLVGLASGLGPQPASAAISTRGDIFLVVHVLYATDLVKRVQEGVLMSA